MMFPPDLVNLDGTHDGEKSDQIRPDVVEGDQSDQGEDAQAGRPMVELHDSLGLMVIGSRQPHLAWLAAVSHGRQSGFVLGFVFELGEQAFRGVHVVTRPQIHRLIQRIALAVGI